MKTKKVGVCLYETTSKLVDESGITNIFSMNRLINFALAETIPKVLKDLKQENNIFYKYAKTIKRRNLREVIQKIRAEEKSKYYFFSRFIGDLKDLMNKPYSNENVKKKRILNIIDLYLLESETFEDNDSITESLKKYRNGFSKSKASTRTIAELLNVKLVNIDKKEIDSIEIQKIHNNLKDL